MPEIVERTRPAARSINTTKDARLKKLEELKETPFARQEVTGRRQLVSKVCTRRGAL